MRSLNSIIHQVCSTMIAEHLVSDLLEQSNLQELNGSEKQFEVETERLNSRLEHARASNAVLALTLQESKAQCDRQVDFFQINLNHLNLNNLNLKMVNFK